MAVGSVHVTVIEPKPAGIVLVMSLMGETTGAVLSAEKKNWKMKLVKGLKEGMEKWIIAAPWTTLKSSHLTVASRR